MYDNRIFKLIEFLGHRATSADPEFFNPITIGNHTFIDRAIANPVNEVWAEAKSLWPEDRIVCTVSIGAGPPPVKDIFVQDGVLNALRAISIDAEEEAKGFDLNHRDIARSA